jgi:flagellar biogenesis protein FliO
MWPRGEVGAGVLIISMNYAIPPMVLQLAQLSLALNLVLTGAFIYLVIWLLRKRQDAFDH